jgi:hypothetical protein
MSFHTCELANAAKSGPLPFMRRLEMRYAVTFVLFVITTSIVHAQTPGSAAGGYVGAVMKGLPMTTQKRR